MTTIKASDIKFSFKRGTAVAKSDWQKTATNYEVKLTFEGRRMTVQWWAGSLAGEPTLFDVLYSLCSDSFGVDESFEDWAGDYGYDEDSREAERIYKAVKRQAERFQNLVGEDAYDFLVSMDEEELREWSEE